MNDICRLIKSLKSKKDKIFAMATITRVDGSAYRREGAKMLIKEDGSYAGTISAGCLEEDLIYHGKQVIESLNAKTVNYDLRSTDDLSWGQGAGCDGDIEVLVEPIGWSFNQLQKDAFIWPVIDQLLNRGEILVSAKCLTIGDQRGDVYLYSGNGEVLEGAKDESIGLKLMPTIKQFIKSGTNVRLVCNEEENKEFLLELYKPKELLYIFGAGPDAEPLVKLASQADFSVAVIDPRSARCCEEYFPDADFRYVEHAETFFQKRQIPNQAYVLIMTHSFSRDQEILQHIAQSSLKYIGVLGPKRRTEKLVVDKNLLPFIHSPIGLAIGAEGPDEISISIVAELIKKRNAVETKEEEPRAVYCER
ncbi:XdhC family protein [Niallia sp. 03133]|uniref:XdhC family protein n=1 Tax=Niallia sp. 03133 TaxID=3458060 RepID=UPI004043E0E0